MSTIAPLSATKSMAPTMARIVLAALAVLTLLVYWPTLYGGYLFDDSIYVVDNADVHVSALHLGDWIKAALSQAGSPQFRALSMLSFAANYYLTGLNPFWFKLTNVMVHLFNGWLLFSVLRELFRLRILAGSNATTAQAPSSRLDLVAAAISGAWLLLPINLTSVAYVSQRMEALATVFVFLGLFWYLRARCRHYSGHDSTVMLWISLIVCTLLATSAKESGALLPLYAACAEFVITGFRNRNGQFDRRVLYIYVTLLLAPLIAGLIWLSMWAFSGVNTFRTFTIAERLLTESRVLIDYIQWTLLPNLNALTFYHDDLTISHNLFDPPTTFFAILSLLALLALALWQRKARPVFCLGVLWFFAGHSMTATIIPLELVFEHRNYFPSMGLLLAAASLIGIEPGSRVLPAKIFVAAGFIVFCAFTTFLRAEEWSNPLRLAYTEALKRPNSPRAQYELALTLIRAAGDDNKSPLVDESRKVLERAANNPDSGIAPLQALIFLDGRVHADVDPRLWQTIKRKLNDRVPSQTDIDAIVFLFRCQQRGDCPVQKQELMDVFTLALARSQGNVYLMSAYADFALLSLDDTDLAERMLRDVVAIKPEVPVYRANLIQFLIATKQFDKTVPEFAALHRLNRLGSLDKLISKLESAQQSAMSVHSPAHIPNVQGSDENSRL